MLRLRGVVFCFIAFWACVAVSQEASVDEIIDIEIETSAAPVSHEQQTTDVNMRFDRESFSGGSPRVSRFSYPQEAGSDLVPILGIVFVFGMPALIIALAIYFASRRHQAKVDLVRDIVTSGQAIPESLSTILQDESKTTPLGKAIQMLAVGIGLAIMLSVLAEPKIGVVGVLFMCIGAGQLVVHFLEKKRQNDV